MSPDSMTSGWYYAKEGASIGHEVGPLSWEELYVLARVGTLAPSDLVWNPKLPRGVAAGQIPGLFSVHMGPSVAQAGPAAHPAPPVVEPQPMVKQAPAVPEPQPVPQEAPPVGKPQPAVKRSPAVEWAEPAPAPEPALEEIPLAWDFEPTPRETPAAASVEPVPEEAPAAAVPVHAKVDELFTSAAETPADHELSPDEPEKTPAGTRHSRLPWLIVLLALVIAAAGLVAYFMFLREGTDGSDGSGQTPTTRTQSATGIMTATTEEAVAPAAAAAWRELSPAGDVPSPRDGHGLVYDPVTDKMILFGGSDFDMKFADTWTYDPGTNRWAKLYPAGPSPSARTYHQMVYNSASGKVILFGGLDSASGRNDTWVYNPAANTWTELRPAGSLPAERQGHALVYDPVSDRLILFGGWDQDRGKMLSDTWSYDSAANTWTELSPAGDMPPARQGHAMIYDPASSQVLLFGGWSSSSGTNLSDTWSYDPAANNWTELEPAGDLPVARQGHALAYDPGSGHVLLFGGWNSEGELNDTWSYDPVTDTWTELSPAGDAPRAREGHSMAYDDADDKVILFGGFDDPGRSHFSDTWAYSPSSSR